MCHLTLLHHEELDKGNYEVDLNFVNGKPTDTEVAIRKNGDMNWKKIAMAKYFKNGYYAGDITIENPGEPVHVMFKANGNKVALNRAMLINTKQ